MKLHYDSKLFEDSNVNSNNDVINNLSEEVETLKQSCQFRAEKQTIPTLGLWKFKGAR